MNNENKPEHVTQKMETDLMNEVENFYPENAEDVYETWNKNDMYILLAKYTREDETVTRYILIRAFFIGQKPAVSVDFDGTESDLITMLMTKYYWNK